MRSYVGNVSIGEEAKGFEMKLNREGFISSKSVDELKEFVRFAIEWATVLRDFQLREDSREVALIAKSEFEEVIQKKVEPSKIVEAAISYLESEVSTITRSLPSVERREVEQSFYKATEAIKKHNDSNKAELLHLRLVASTSTLLLIFSHEVKSLLGLLEESKNKLQTITKSLKLRQKESVLKITTSFVTLKERLEQLLELTSLVGMDHRKIAPGQVALRQRIAKVEKIFELITRKYEIEIDYTEVPNNIVIKKILEAELYSILLNVLSNSIKSVIASGKHRKIKIIANRSEGKNVILIKDTGVGLDASQYEDVFTPFIADPTGKLYKRLESKLNPEDRLIVGTGSGLGLGIVKEIVSAHDGDIRFITPDRGWNAVLEIKLS